MAGGSRGGGVGTGLARLYVYILVPPSLALPPCVSAGCPWRQGGRTYTPLVPILAATTTYQCSLLRLSAGRSALPVQQPVYIHKQNMPTARTPRTPTPTRKAVRDTTICPPLPCTGGNPCRQYRVYSVSLSLRSGGRWTGPRAEGSESRERGPDSCMGPEQAPGGPGASYPPVCTRREAQNARGRQHHGIHQTYICERL